MSYVNAEHSTNITVVSDTSVRVEELNNNAIISRADQLWTTIPGAQYIWATRDGNNLVDRLDEFGPWTFIKSFNIPSDYEDCTGSIKITADNEYTLYVNGQLIGEAGNFFTIETYALTGIQTGTNEIKVVGVNLEPERVDPNTNPAMVLFRAELNCAGIHDSTPPDISVPDKIIEEATGPEGAAVSFDVSAEDDVDGPVDVNCGDYSSGNTFPLGSTTVTCTAEDSEGNSAQESFTIEVVDTTAPELSIYVDNKKGQAIQNGGNTESKEVRVTFQTTDAVDSSPDTECSLNGGAISPCTSPTSYNKLVKGNYEFTLRATDDAGNTSEETFRWIVK